MTGMQGGRAGKGWMETAVLLSWPLCCACICGALLLVPSLPETLPNSVVTTPSIEHMGHREAPGPMVSQQGSDLPVWPEVHTFTADPGRGRSAGASRPQGTWEFLQVTQPVPWEEGAWYLLGPAADPCPFHTLYLQILTAQLRIPLKST